MLNGCQRLERKEFILWLLVEEIGVFLDKGHGESRFQFFIKKMVMRFCLTKRLLIISKNFLVNMEQIFGGIGMLRIFCQKITQKNRIYGKKEQIQWMSGLIQDLAGPQYVN